MGEIADMMLDGIMCQLCGEFIGDGDGYPVVCAGCQSQHNVDQFGEPRGAKKTATRGINASPKPVKCRTCTKRFYTQEAADQHERDKHQEAMKLK